MSDDVAMQNFTANTLRGMGTGGSTGASNNTEFGLFKFEDDLWQKANQISPFFGLLIYKACSAMQGFVQSITPNQLFNQLTPPVTPIGGGQKLPNVMGKR
ncbi:hypothetical protein I862_01650 [endosymbiont of Acanthamoeba sp. UWC8]|uniref:hypothetical protein n=1 Tax=endosymbiont of Acanthamoeba sp. UWC8 TaxID=86106 RepID=UPI0004D17C61|nr:hypothetical protein [endosymbiont of Acanthamoeba sp. UWC8]AIF80893.1 hypothetical protein I862_01650 [endosymbiont of Acanthamoeba sp. UWC8]